MEQPFLAAVTGKDDENDNGEVHESRPPSAVVEAVTSLAGRQHCRKIESREAEYRNGRKVENQRQIDSLKD